MTDFARCVRIVGALWLLTWASGALAGDAIGPVITFSGLANPQGMVLPTNQVDSGSGFLIVIEGAPGPLHRPVGTGTFDPTMLPDIQFQVTQRLGNGSADVCDTMPPMVGGVPATSPPDLSFANVDAVNDLACRFTAEGCLVNPFGEPIFANASSTVQFCAFIAPTLAFQGGATLVTMRLRNVDGVVGPIRQMTVQVGPVGATPTRTPSVTMAASATATATPPLATATRTMSPTPTSSSARTASASATATPPAPTSTSSVVPSATTPPATAMATSTRTADDLIDLDSLIHALFSLDPPAAADVNGDRRVTAPDLTAHRLRSA